MNFTCNKRLIGLCLIMIFVLLPMLAWTPLSVNAASSTNSIENKPFPTEKVDSSQIDDAKSTSLGWTAFKLVFSLLVIILLAYLVIRVFGKQANRRFRGRWLQVIDELIIGPNRGVVLCEIGGRILALGVTDHSINVLFEIDDQDLIKEMLAVGGTEEPGEWSQLTAMRGLIDRVRKQRNDRFGSSLDQWAERFSDNSKERGHQ
ncbi:MAG: flagellar biosynthetic protein FliO [Methylocystaceae bacterium]